MLKGQSEALSIILITGIIISMIGAAYLWGAPLIEKRSSVTELSIAEDFITELNSKIVEIANSGGGEATLKIPKGKMTIVPYNYSTDENNSLLLDFFVTQQMVFPNTVVYVRTNNIEPVATYGESEPRIMTLESEPFGDSYRMTLRSFYRELVIDNPAQKKGFRIAINRGQQPLSGDQEISISFGSIELLPGQSSNGGDLMLTHVNVLPL